MWGGGVGGVEVGTMHVRTDLVRTEIGTLLDRTASDCLPWQCRRCLNRAGNLAAFVALTAASFGLVRNLWRLVVAA